MNSNEEFLQSMKGGIRIFCNDNTPGEPEELEEHRYSVLEMFATGGMKDIYIVRDNVTGRLLAKAVIKAEASQEIKDSFLSEAKLTASLAHPNIVSVYDLGEDEDGPWFTMEFLKGKNLREAIEEKTLSERLDILLKVCDALSYAHANDIIHRDIKPDNIQVGDFGEVTLCDWGLAKKVSQKDDDYELDLINNQTLHGVIKGTPGFMAPEQILGEEVTFQTDIFALGGLLYFITENEAPFKEETLEDSLKSTVKGKISFSHTPIALKAVIQKALNVNTKKRYNSVSDMKAEIENYINGFATEAENASFLRQFSLFYKRNKTISNFIGLAVTIILVITFFFIKELKQREKALIKSNLTAIEARNNAEKNLQKYIDEQERLSQERIKHSNELTQHSINLKARYSFVYSLQKADEAISKNPKNNEAWFEKGYNHFIRLEMKEAYDSFEKAKLNGYEKLDDLQKISFKYMNKNLKDVDNIARVIQEVDKSRKYLCFYILVQLNRKGIPNKDLAKVVFSLISKINNIENIEYAFNGQDLTLSNNPSLKQLTYRGRVRLNLLYYLKFQKLNLDSTGLANFENFDQLKNLEELSICNTNVSGPETLLSLKKLKKLHISKGAYSQIISDLRKQGVEVIEK